MNTLQSVVSKNEVLKIHSSSDETSKTKLEKIFGSEVFQVEITDRIKTLLDALDYNGKTLESFKWETERDNDQQRATKELEEIALALREGKELAMDAYWYYPWMKRPVSSGVGFSYGVYLCARSASAVGARLCVDTSEKAIYMGKQFADIYTRHLSPNRPSASTIFDKNVNASNTCKKMSISDVKTYEDICAIDGVDPVSSLPFPNAITAEQIAINSFSKIIRIARVLNEGWKPNWNDNSEAKYYPWFDMEGDQSVGSGVGFSSYDFNCDGSNSSVGARLVYKTSELAEFAGKQFLDIYRGFMVIE